jgi:hypothetical protein
MKRRSFLSLVALAVTLGLMGVEDVGAAEFSPTIAFTPSDTKAGGNGTLGIKVAQDKDEEELQRVELRVPAGFTLPTDEQIPNSQKLGEGNIIIDVGPRCSNPANPLSGSGNVPVNIIEKDRTSAETAEGAIAVWVVDLRPVTTINLLVKGSPTDGYTLAGDIPQNPNTCPPFQFNATIAKTAPNGVPIIKNPANGGTYELGALFTGVAGSTAEIKQPVEITGGGAGGGGTTTTGGSLTAAEKKQCKKKFAKLKQRNPKKYKKKLKACFKRQRAD